MLNMAVLVSGGGTNLQAIINAIEDGLISNARLRLVISSKEGAYALERAAKAGVEGLCLSPSCFGQKEEFAQALLCLLEERAIDLIVLAGYLVVLPEVVVRTYKDRIINVHPSLLPAFGGDGYYGLKVHAAALERGVRITGATVHFVDEGTDTGPILLQKAVAVHSDDTPEILQKRVMEEAEWTLLPWAVELIAQGKVAVEEQKVIIRE